MIKRFVRVSFLMSAIGVPYLWSTGSEWLALAKTKLSGPAPAALEPAAEEPVAAVHHGGHSFGEVPMLASAKKTPVEGYGRYQLAEVLHFEGTPAWVMSRWPRVTSGLAEPDMQGYRVPLVTGTGENDIAGSLTYYFDAQQHVKLFHFRGTTANPHQLVAFVTERYGLKPQPTSDPGLQLYQVKWNGKPTSELRVRTTEIVRAAQPYSRYHVELAVRRP
jgi:hypothetical protein